MWFPQSFPVPTQSNCYLQEQRLLCGSAGVHTVTDPASLKVVLSELRQMREVCLEDQRCYQAGSLAFLYMNLTIDNPSRITNNKEGEIVQVDVVIPRESPPLKFLDLFRLEISRDVTCHPGG